jgi:hypothetical protein
VTQPSLFALTDGEHSEVTEGGIITLSDEELRCAKVAEQNVRGDIAEYRCAEQLTLRGYSCTVLGGRFKGFDIIADRDDIRAQHVQVKHGFLTFEPSQQRYRIHNSTRGGILYSANAYDILVFYMWDRNQWLVYSRAELGNRTNTSYVPPELRRVARKSWSGAHGEAIADRRPNNWELFDQLAIANSQQSAGVTQQMSHPTLDTSPILL